MTAVEKKLKLVRVVLFLDWNNRGDWTTCLEEAAEKTKVSFDGKKINLSGYVGRFSQYSLKSGDGSNLFPDEIWRFIEVVDGVLLDSYVFFCKKMERVNGFFVINGFLDKRVDQVSTGGFDCSYIQDVLRGFSLSFPDVLQRKIGDVCGNGSINKYAVFHHSHIVKQYCDQWTIKENVGIQAINRLFRKENSFSSIPFFYEVNIMRKIIVVVPSGDLNDKYLHGYDFVRLLDPKTFTNDNYSLTWCIGKLAEDILLDENTTLYGMAL